MEREIPIKMIGNQEEKIKDDLRPLVTFTEDSSDEDESSECAQECSVQESEYGLANLKKKFIGKILYLAMVQTVLQLVPESRLGFLQF